MTDHSDEGLADAGSGRSMGHVALHYGEPAEGPLAARLLSTIGLVETQMLPLPGGNFYRFVVEGRHFARGDGIVYLSALPEPQRKLVDAIHAAFAVGTDNEHDVVKDWREMMTADPEASFHFGFLLESLEDLEQIVQALRGDPELKERTNIVLNRPRPGDSGIDARLDASPVFEGVTRYAYGRAGVQAFIETDLLKAGQLGDSMVVELDFVFPDHAQHILSVVEL
jgi:hypothetical protein